MNTRFLPNSAGRALGIAAAFAFIHAVSPGQNITGTSLLLPLGTPEALPLSSDPILTNITFGPLPALPGTVITGVDFTFTPGSVIIGGDTNTTDLLNSIALGLVLPPEVTAPSFVPGAAGVPQTAGQPNINAFLLAPGALDTGVALSGFVGTGAPVDQLSSNFGVTSQESTAILSFLNSADGSPIGIGLLDYNLAHTNGIDIVWNLPQEALTVTFITTREVPFSPVQWLGIGAILLMAAAKIGWRRMPGMVGLC
jgi:hypothetical protein